MPGVGSVVAGFDDAGVRLAEMLALFGMIEHECAVVANRVEYHRRDCIRRIERVAGGNRRGILADMNFPFARAAEFVRPVLGVVGLHSCGDAAGAIRGGVDVMRLHLEAEIHHETDDAHLGSRIGNVTGNPAREQSGHGRRGADMPAITRFDHAGKERARRVYHAMQVDLNDPVDVVVRHFHQRIE